MITGPDLDGAAIKDRLESLLNDNSKKARAAYDGIFAAYDEGGLKRGCYERERVKASILSWPFKWMRFGFKVRAISGQVGDECRRLLDQLESDHDFLIKQLDSLAFPEEIEEQAKKQIADAEREYAEGDPIRAIWAARLQERVEENADVMSLQEQRVQTQREMMKARQDAFWETQRKWRESSGWPGS